MIKPTLDKNFKPIHLELKKYEELVNNSTNTEYLYMVVERNKGLNYRYDFKVFKEGSMYDSLTYRLAERIVKSILWVAGGYKIYVSGVKWIYEKLKNDYSKDGVRAFDNDFMSTVYDKPFEVVYIENEKDLPKVQKASVKVGGFLKGCRIGFDAGGSDRKVSAVVDGEVIYSEEVVWNPKTTSDPTYHYNEILAAMKTAASKMERVDAIGVSSAGVYIDNKAKVASLFVKVDKSKYKEYCENIYINVGKEMGVPLVVANDGDVTALAGALDLKDNSVLGMAMGTSEAVGYINNEGCLNEWLSELAFAPVDLCESAMQDEWSGDYGVGCKYFSQDAVIKLAQYGGYKFEDGLTPAQKLKVVQKMVEEGNELATQVFTDIGIYLANTIPFYSRFYDIKHLMLLGRVMGGKGGDIILDTCKKVLKEDFNEYSNINITLPSEWTRRVGQSIAAASLPKDNE